MRCRVGRSRRAVAVLSVVLIVGVSVASVVANGSAVGASAPALDHFECYAAATTSTRALRASFRAKPHTARLKNKFASNEFTVGLGKVAMQCSPAKQTAQIAGHKVVSPITDAKARLVCWATAPKALRLPGSVTLANQFGIGTVTPTAARSLCLASWKNGSKPLAFPSTNAPSNLDTYACYTAVHLAGQASFSPPSRVTLDDQFGNATTRVGAPNIVCLPTSRYVNTHHSWTRIVNPAHDIVCFALATTAAARTTYDKNAFGTGAVKTTRRTELCVPSTTTTIPPPTTTTAAPTTTTVPVPAHWTPSSAAPISWYWQLAGTVNLSEPAEVYDIDGFSVSAATVTALHAQGKTVICYINVGASENFRSDYASFPASVQGLSNGWPARPGWISASSPFWNRS